MGSLTEEARLAMEDALPRGADRSLDMHQVLAVPALDPADAPDDPDWKKFVPETFKQVLDLDRYSSS